MRRILALAMLIFGILTIVIGIAEMSPRHSGPPVAHIFVASVLVILCLVHLWLNRKAVLRCIRGR